MADGRSKKRPGAEEQAQIIKTAAAGLFTEHGTQSVSIAQICTAADISRPTFYRCFKDKDELLAALYQSSVAESVYQSMMDNPEAFSGSLDQLKPALESIYDSIFENAELASLVFRESNNPASPAYTIVHDAFNQVADILLEHLPMAGSEGAKRVFLMSLMTANQWIVHNAIIQGLGKQHIDEAKEAAWMLVSQVFSELQTNE